MKEEALPKSTFAWNGNHRLKHVKCMFPFHARRKGRTWNNHRPHSTLCGTFAFHANFIFLPLAWPHTARLGKEVGRELVRAEVWARRGRCRRRSRYIQHISRGAGRSEWPEMAFCAPDPTSDPRVRSGKRPQKAVGAPSPSGFKYLGRGGRKEGKVWKVGKTGREGGRKEGGKGGGGRGRGTCRPRHGSGWRYPRISSDATPSGERREKTRWCQGRTKSGFFAGLRKIRTLSTPPPSPSAAHY